MNFEKRIGLLNTRPDSIESRELNKLKSVIKIAHKVVDGEQLFGYSTLNLLKSIIDDAHIAGFDLGEEEAEAVKLIECLPRCELSNCLNIARSHLSKGELSLAKQWHAEASNSLRLFIQDGLLEESEKVDFAQDLDELELELYA